MKLPDEILVGELSKSSYKNIFKFNVWIWVFSWNGYIDVGDKFGILVTDFLYQRRHGIEGRIEDYIGSKPKLKFFTHVSLCGIKVAKIKVVQTIKCEVKKWRPSANYSWK